MKIIITYEDEMVDYGSVRLRAFQVAESLSQQTPLEIKPLSECLSAKNTFFILVKPRNYKNFKKLIGSGNILTIDPLDTVNLLDQPCSLLKKIMGCTPKQLLKEVDAAIFCSDKTRQAYKHYFKHPDMCKTIYHHWDSRLTRDPKRNFSHVKAAYFGLARKAHLASELSSIDFHDLRSYNEMSACMFESYNAHYIVKPENAFYQYEPLTKISTAAFAQSPVIASKGHEQELLTADYPYYVEGMAEKDIRCTIDKMQQTYNDKEWQQASDIMESVYEMTSLPQLTKEYMKFINQLTK